MTVYLDSSVFLKAFFEEPDSHRATEILTSDTDWITGRHTYVEVRRNLARALEGPDAGEARAQFDQHWQATAVVELDEAVCIAAADIAEVTGVMSLDALHLGAAQRAAAGSIPLATFDLRLAQAARSLGWQVLGA